MNCFKGNCQRSPSRRKSSRTPQAPQYKGVRPKEEEEDGGWTRAKEARLRSSASRAAVLRALMSDFLNQHCGGGTQLHAAASLADEATCHRLLAEGADIAARCSDFGATVLHYAALNETHGEALLPFFVAHGIEPDVKDDAGHEPIHYALRVGNLSIADKMLRLRGGPGAIGDTLLHFCVRHKLLREAEHVLKCNNMQLHMKGEMGRTPLHVAALTADVQTCDWLLRKGAIISTHCGFYGGTVLHHAAMNISDGAELLVDLFVHNGANIEAKSMAGETPLQIALFRGNLHTAKRLKELGANMSVLGKDGRNLLQMCLERNVVSSARFVLDHCKEQLHEECGAAGEMALHVAARHCDYSTCAWLVNSGANPLARTDEGFGVTPLQLAELNSKCSDELVSYFKTFYILIESAV